MRWVLALLFLTGVAFAQSQQPSPSGGKNSQPEQSQPQSSQQPPATEQRGTDQAPFTIKILPAQKTDTKANAETQRSDEKAAVDWRLMIYTGLIALFTLFLFAAATAQVLVLISQLRHLATQAKAMVSVESPVPEISDIKLVQYKDWVSPEALGDRISPGAIPDFCKVLVHIKNFGRSSMHITSFCIERCVCKELPANVVYKSIDDSWQPWLAPYDGLWFMPSDNLIAVHLTAGEKSDIQNDNAIFWVYGYITYLNVLGELLTHKFLYRWDLTKGFIRENRPGYT